MRLIDNKKVSMKKIKEYCLRHHITKLSLFGSALRNELTPKSDIDILVEFDHNNVPGFFDLFNMEKELSALLNNRKIDLRTPKDLSKYIRNDVLKEAEVLYNETWSIKTAHMLDAQNDIPKLTKTLKKIIREEE